MDGLNMGIVKEMPLPLPPVAEQRQFVDRLRRVEQQQVACAESAASVDGLLKVFKAELSPVGYDEVVGCLTSPSLKPVGWPEIQADCARAESYALVIPGRPAFTAVGRSNTWLAICTTCCGCRCRIRMIWRRGLMIRSSRPRSGWALRRS